MSHILTTKQLCKDGDTKSILYNLDLTIESGTITALIGMSGDGKEKLLDILSGFDEYTSGSISLKDKPYAPKNTSSGIKSGIIMISEKANLAPDLTIKEHLTLGLRSSIKSSRILPTLKRVGLNNFKPNTLCSTLTAAQSHLLLLARAILSNSEIYLFNKVDSAFNKKERELYFSIMQELKVNGATIIFIPAIVEELSFVDRYIGIKNGTLIKPTGSIADFINTIYHDDDGNIFNKTASSRSNTIVMESIGLKGSVLKDASINIRDKEICGLFGLKGSGIEELFAILIGKASSTGGVLSANGVNLQARKISPVKVHKAGISVFNGLRQQELDYDSRCVILRSFSSNILLLLDPANGLAPSERKNFYSLLNELKQQGKAIILYTPSIEELKGVSDSIAIIHNGELSAARSTDNWTDEEIYKYVTSGKLEAFSIL